MSFGDEKFLLDPLPFLEDWPDVDMDDAEFLGTKKRQLIARCRDLIHITPDPDAPVLFAERVGFLHRMVVDFLHAVDTREKLQRLAADDFDPKRTLLKANLGQTRSLMHLYRLTYMMPYLQRWILGVLKYAQEIEISSRIAEAEVLDELEMIINKAFAKWDFSHAMHCLFGMAEIESFLELVFRCDLALYAGRKLPKHTASELDKMVPRWKERLEIRQTSDFELRKNEAADSWRGQNGNFVQRGTACWERRTYLEAWQCGRSVAII
ncbi:hypothetical protein F5Y16DRAFT_415245 [Xylariaceae sp. FL0255]|nr:hypothetical protein F5Y16DRAFT_415245 [Xylariaceae sp. FL0255]